MRYTKTFLISVISNLLLFVNYLALITDKNTIIINGVVVVSQAILFLILTLLQNLNL